jgi:tetratricopeptide (TPR) repeat protein
MKLHQKISLVLFGLFLTIVILEIGLRIGGLAILSIQEYRNQQSIKQKGSFRIMCLGESTTQDQYPPYLEKILNQSNVGIKFSVIDKGIAGTNTGVILSDLEANIDKYQPDMVVTMMGINDGGGHIPYETASTSKIVLTLRSLKVYKLTRLIWLHIATKFKEAPKKQDSIQQEQSFKKALELNPNNYSAYIESGFTYRNQGKFTESEQIFKKSIESNPNIDSAYIGLGWLYRDQKRFVESEQLFRKAIELNPNNDSAYIGLGWVYKEQRKYTESEKLFKKAIELDPNYDFAYIGLGCLYIDQGKLAEEEQSFKKAIELNPNNEPTYITLGWLYIDQKRFAESEHVLNKAIELNPKDDSAYAELGWIYIVQGKFAESEQALKKAIELNPDNERYYGNLAIVYSETGNNEFSEVYAKKADSLRNEYYNLNVTNHYHMLKQILDKRKIKLICVQYPMRNIEPLKKVFKEKTEGSIIFVDNEKIFKDAVRKEGYKEYFTDMFGGDFGHCTEKGNRLLAENIASVILKEISGK